MKNKAGEKEMKIHQKTVRSARSELTKDASHLGKKIDKKMTFALSQDKKIMREMRSADRKK